MFKQIDLFFVTGVAALFTCIFDLAFNARDSLSLKIGEVFRAFLFPNWETSAWAGIFILTGFAVFLCHVRQPKGRVSAAEIGLGVVSIVATLAAPFSQETISKVSLSSIIISHAFAEQDELSGSLKLDLEAANDNSEKKYAIQVRDASSGKILSSKESESKTIALDEIRAKGEYLIYVESKGLKWTKYKVNYDGNEKIVKINPIDSKLPMVFQRLLGPAEVDVSDKSR